MPTGVLLIALPLAIAIFGVLFRSALEVRRDANYRGMWGTIFWSIVPCAVVALIWASNGDAPEMVRNITLGLVGAMLGASALIWGGYAVQGTTTKPTTKASEPQTTVNQNVTSHGQRWSRLSEGAVAGVVGIRCGALSGNMKVQFQAARSIG